MEFLRFGSTIPGSYWGCCACCIIQNFKVDPDASAAIQLVSGDGGAPIIDMESRQPLYSGPTYRDIFWQRLRFGTHNQHDKPNHAFLAIITQTQIDGAYGKKWLEILHEAGFEFIRSVSNSVYTGSNLAKYSKDRGSARNYIFALVRNIGERGDGDPLTPPDAWKELTKDDKNTEAWQFISDEDRLDLAARQHTRHTEIFNRIGPARLLPEAEMAKLCGENNLWLAGLRSENKQEKKVTRQKRNEVKAAAVTAQQAATAVNQAAAAVKPVNAKLANPFG